MAKTKANPFQKHLERAASHNQTNPARKSFHVTYHKQGTGRVVKRKIEPLKVQNGLVVAYDHKRKAIRSFKLERIRSMEKNAFWEGFEKQAMHPAAELAGLGMLATPSIQALRGKKMKEHHKDMLEVGGLGVLAAPYAKDLITKAIRRGR